MTFNRDDPNTWPCFNPLIIAHDVGRSDDRSTAVDRRKRSIRAEVARN